MKKLTRDRVVPIISARVSCVIGGMKFSGSPGLPNSAISNRIRAKLFFQAEDGIRDYKVTGVQTCALPISSRRRHTRLQGDWSSDVCSSDLVDALEVHL